MTTDELYDSFIRNGLAVGFTDDQIDFLWTYFQEQRHEESVRELEDEYPLYKKEYNELPEIVDNQNTDKK